MSRFYTQGAGRGPSPELDEYADRSRLNRASQPAGRRQHQQHEYHELEQGGYSNRPQFDYREEGYNRDQSFDLRADFDGNGPRWSEMYGAAKQETWVWALLR